MLKTIHIICSELFSLGILLALIVTFVVYIHFRKLLAFFLYYKQTYINTVFQSIIGNSRLFQSGRLQSIHIRYSDADQLAIYQLQLVYLRRELNARKRRIDAQTLPEGGVENCPSEGFSCESGKRQSQRNHSPSQGAETRTRESPVQTARAKSRGQGVLR